MDATTVFLLSALGTGFGLVLARGIAPQNGLRYVGAGMLLSTGVDAIYVAQQKVRRVETVPGEHMRNFISMAGSLSMAQLMGALPQGYALLTGR